MVKKKEAKPKVLQSSYDVLRHFVIDPKDDDTPYSNYVMTSSLKELDTWLAKGWVIAAIHYKDGDSSSFAFTVLEDMKIQIVDSEGEHHGYVFNEKRDKIIKES